MLGTVSSSSLRGIDGQAVRVEVHVSSGFPGFTIVGLPDAACKESRDRVRSAFLSSGLQWKPQKTTINLAPTSVRKGGAGLDLAIAIGLLLAREELDADVVQDVAFFGELGLDGSIRPIDGVLSLVDAVPESTVVVPVENVREAELLRRHKVRTARNLADLVCFLRNEVPWADIDLPASDAVGVSHPDFCDVRGHKFARWALEVAAAGGHHSLLVGPPGSGKSMLARRLPSILPPLKQSAALETTRIYSVAGLLRGNEHLVTTAPLRAPHHTASSAAIIGGGSSGIRPGEVALAHNGVLFLDEFPEFAANVCEALRQPLEEGFVRVSRAIGTVEFPARFQLVATMNPCPCGEANSSLHCYCSEASRFRYTRRVSSPILDRIDIRVYVDRVDSDQLLHGEAGESSAEMQIRVAQARSLAEQRGVHCNSQMTGSDLEKFASLSVAAQALLLEKLEANQLSGRGLTRVRRVARTIADLDGGDETISDEHIAAALVLRSDAGTLKLAA